MHYGESDVPEAKFMYDISPMAVVVSRGGRHWYEFLTSVLSICGGLISVLGIIDGAIYQIRKYGKKD